MNGEKDAFLVRRKDQILDRSAADCRVVAERQVGHLLGEDDLLITVVLVVLRL
jgi:hypothetical protein